MIEKLKQMAYKNESVKLQKEIIALQKENMNLRHKLLKCMMEMDEEKVEKIFNDD